MHKNQQMALAYEPIMNSLRRNQQNNPAQKLFFKYPEINTRIKKIFTRQELKTPRNR